MSFTIGKKKRNPIFTITIPFDIRNYLHIKPKEKINVKISKIKENNRISFSAFLKKSTEDYFIVPLAIVRAFNIKENEIFVIKLLNTEFPIRIRSSTSKYFTVPKRYVNHLKLNIKRPYDLTLEYVKITRPSHPKLEFIEKDGLFLVDILKLLPRRNKKCDWHIIDRGDYFYALFKSKHVKGLEIKFVKSPKLVEREKFGELLGLINSDGIKSGTSFGFVNGDLNVIKNFIRLVEPFFSIEEFTGYVMFPEDLFTANTEKVLEKYFSDNLNLNKISVNKSHRRKKSWSPTGILVLLRNNVASLLLMTSLLNAFKNDILKVDYNKTHPMIKSFLSGVLQGDGGPILEKGILKRVMIATGKRDEAEFYTKLILRLGIYARNVWDSAEEGDFVEPYLMKVDIAPRVNELIKLENLGLTFGSYDNGNFYGSLERQFKFLKGLYNRTSTRSLFEMKPSLKKDLRRLNISLKNYFLDIKRSGFNLPRHIREYLEGQKEMPIKQKNVKIS